jgi:hypothetical protein
MPQSQPDVSDRKPPLHRRPWVVVGGIALLALGLLGYFYFSDDPPSDDSDLMPSPAPTDEPNNPLAVFCREMGKHNLDDWSRTLPREVKDLAREHDAKLEAYLSSHAAEQGIFNALMQSEPTSWRWPGVDASLSSKTDLGCLSPCLEYVNLLARGRVLRLAWAGKHREASEEALKAVRFGNGLVKTDGPMLHHLMAVTIQRIGEDLVKAAVVDATDMSLLTEVQESLASLEVSSKQVARVLRIEYLFGKNSPASTTEELELMGLGEWERIAVRYVMLPNRTQAEHAQRIRRVVRALEQDWAQAMLACDAIDEEFAQARESKVKLLSAPNLGGKFVGFRSWGSAGGLIRKSCGVTAMHRMTVAMLALRRFEGKHGRLPATLEELVPEFLPAVPVDPFDGKPLRWKPDEMWVYSVSGNGTDNHGAHDVAMRVSFGQPDLVMPYWWLPEARERK